MNWGEAINGKYGVPILPTHLASTTRCGKNIERWQARRAIIIRQRNVLLKKLQLGLGVNTRLEARVDRCDERIEACNRVIDALVVAEAHPEEPVDHYEVARVAKKKRKKDWRVRR